MFFGLYVSGSSALSGILWKCLSIILSAPSKPNSMNSSMVDPSIRNDDVKPRTLMGKCGCSTGVGSPASVCVLQVALLQDVVLEIKSC